MQLGPKRKAMPSYWEQAEQILGPVEHSEHGNSQGKQTPALLPKPGGQPSSHLLLLRKELDSLVARQDVQKFAEPLQVKQLLSHSRH